MTKAKFHASRLYGVVMIVIISLFLGVAVVEFSFKNRLPKNPLNSTQIWDHRGLVQADEIQENTIESYQNALHAGASGIEMDIFYDDEVEGFVVSHDKPYQLQSDSSWLSLDQVFSIFGDSIYYWLDLKNLNSNNLKKVITRLEYLQDRYAIRDMVYVESGNSWSAYRMSKSQNINTILWIQYSSHKPIISWVKKLYYKFLIATGNFSAISRGYKYADEDFQSAFASFPCFIFHIYSLSELEETAEWVPKGSVLLVDSPYYRNSLP